MLEVFFAYPWFFVGLITALGLCVGSFSNVVIHRLPVRWDRQVYTSLIETADIAVQQPELGLSRVPAQERAQFRPGMEAMGAMLRALMKYLPDETVVKPRSRCPNCGHGITAAENVPVLSYLWLRGKCSACKTPISLRYPLIEAFCGVVAGLIAWRFGPSVSCAAALLLFFWLVPLAMIDADTAYLPNESTLPLLWVGLLFNLFKVFVPLEDAVAGAVIGYLFLAIPAFTFEWLRKMDTPAMGRGDFVLMAVAGTWFGWGAILPIVLLSSCVGAAVGIAMLAAKRADVMARIPFGPYIAGATLVYLFVGTWLKDWLGLPF
ncbi:MAG TPA: A24 family peptidase [Burkholderiales bacterium]